MVTGVLWRYHLGCFQSVWWQNNVICLNVAAWKGPPRLLKISYPKRPFNLLIHHYCDNPKSISFSIHSMIHNILLILHQHNITVRKFSSHDRKCKGIIHKKKKFCVHSLQLCIMIQPILMMIQVSKKIPLNLPIKPWMMLFVTHFLLLLNHQLHRYKFHPFYYARFIHSQHVVRSGRRKSIILSPMNGFFFFLSFFEEP